MAGTFTGTLFDWHRYCNCTRDRRWWGPWLDVVLAKVLQDLTRELGEALRRHLIRVPVHVNRRTDTIPGMQHVLQRVAYSRVWAHRWSIFTNWTMSRSHPGSNLSSPSKFSRLSIFPFPTPMSKIDIGSRDASPMAATVSL